MGPESDQLRGRANGMDTFQRRRFPGIPPRPIFEEAAKRKDEVTRDVQFTVPPGSADILQELPGFQDFSALTEVLRMLRCGFGLKDAPRLWNKLLSEVLQSLGLKPLQSDQQLYVWHVPSPGGPGARGPQPAQRLVLIISTHVDDLKGAGEEVYRKRLIKALEERFDKLNIKLESFECIGVMHEQDSSRKAIWAHQQHYVPPDWRDSCRLESVR